MRLSSPLYLLLLLTLPIFLWLGWPSRGPTRRREIASLALRLIIVLALILSLAGLEIARHADELAVVFLVDASDSMPAQAKGLAAAYMQQALEAMGPNDQAAIVVFGEEALVERPMSPSKELAQITSIPRTLGTDLAEAIRLGLALFPAESAKRMILLSDGRATTGDAEEAARLAAGGGVQIIAVPFLVTPGDEALLTRVHAPAHLRQGEQFGLEFTIQSNANMRAAVRVLAGAAVADEFSVDLRLGANSFTRTLTAGAPGFAAYRVQIAPERDTYYQNNELAAFSQIEGPPRILIVRPETSRDGVDETSALEAALGASGLQTNLTQSALLPAELSTLSEYSSVVLVNVPARDLAPRQMQALQTYVRDLGGGLLAVGGPDSYGVGGYFRTPLEEMLPVEMQLQDEERRPRLTLVLVIDKSGSMADSGPGGVQKVDLAKEAAIRSVQLLNPGDRIGIVAFDDSATWVAPIQPLEQPDMVINRIGTIRAGGGTDILAGVRAAAAQLQPDPAALKHVVLLTDGGASPAGIPELVQSMHDEHNITLSSVAVGEDAARELLQQLAQIGGGRYHFTNNPATIPQIFTEETTLATRAYIIEEQFFPKQVSPSPILAGIQTAPWLLGYVGTTAKDSAQTILVSGQDDPILAAWQYGLGKAVAWTSDATGRWAKAWLTWGEFPRFWAQAVRWTISEGTQQNVEVSVAQAGESAVLTVDAVNQAGEYLNGLEVTANVVDPAGRAQSVLLSQIAPGRYQAEFAPTVEGVYWIRVSGMEESAAGVEAPEADGASSVAHTAGWVLAYAPEYANAGSDPNTLARVAAITGGRITTGDPAEAFAHTLAARRATRPIWPWLLLLAVVLLPLDVAVRRLVVTRYDLLRAWAGLRERLAPRRARRAPVRAERLTALFRAKERAGKERPTVAQTSPPPPASPQAAAGPAIRPPQPSAASAPEEPAQPAASTAAALLARKRARQDRQG